LRILSRSQHLSPYICVKYVIYGGSEGKYGDCNADKLLDINDILLRQPHITKEEISDMYEFVYGEEKKELKELINMGKYDRPMPIVLFWKPLVDSFYYIV